MWLILVLVIVVLICAAVGGGFVLYALRRRHKSALKGNVEVPACDQEAREYYERTAKQVSVLSEDGLTLRGLRLSASTHKWVILVHGYSGRGSEMALQAQQYHQRGFNVLTPDLRAHGGSEGKYIGMGWLDRRDLLVWIGQILSEDAAAQIVLHGHSMGASAVLEVSGEPDLPKNVQAIISDCAYASVWDMFSIILKKWFKLPPFPVLYLASFMSRILCGYSFTKASAINAVAQSKTPTLFIHGQSDDFVPPDMAKTLYKAANCEKKLLIYADAGHCGSCQAQDYYTHIFSFLTQLRAFTHEDIPFLLHRWAPDALPGCKLPKDEEKLRKLIDDWNEGSYKGHPFLFFAIIFGGEPAGIASLLLRGSDASCGISVCTDMQRKGVGFCAMELLKQKAKTLELERLVSRVRADNTASIALHEKCGFTKISDGEICTWEFKL